MNNIHRLLFVVPFIAFTTACGSDDDDKKKPDKNKNGCPAIFDRDDEPDAGSSVSIADGALHIANTNLPIYDPPNLSGQGMTSRVFTGDFTVVVSFENYVSGGSGSFFQALLSTETSDVSASGALGNISEAELTDPAVSAVIVTNGTYSEAANADIVERGATDTSGTITFVHTGTTLTVTTNVAGNEAEKSETVTATQFYLHFQMGNNNTTASVDSETSVDVTEITGPAVVATTFDCDFF